MSQAITRGNIKDLYVKTGAAQTPFLGALCPRVHFKILVFDGDGAAYSSCGTCA